MSSTESVSDPVPVETSNPDALSKQFDRDGQRVDLRPIRTGDEAMHRFFLEPAAREDLRLRFVNYRREFPDDEIALFVDIDLSGEMPFIAEERTRDGCDVLEENLAMRSIAGGDGFNLQHSAHREDALRYVLDLGSVPAHGLR